MSGGLGPREELQAIQEELEVKRRELAHKEVAPIEGRVTDEDRYMVGLLRLEKDIRELEEERRRLIESIEAREDAL